MSRRCAPSATRIPISRVRCSTRCEISPYNPPRENQRQRREAANQIRRIPPVKKPKEIGWQLLPGIAAESTEAADPFLAEQQRARPTNATGSPAVRTV